MAEMPQYYIKSNLSERQIEADVASFFGWCTPEGHAAFRLLDVDEQLTGADKLYDRGMLIYMQFKKSSGLKSTHLLKPSTRRGRSPLEDIREFRAKHELDQDPTLFFQLRAKAKNAKDFQHNILLRYERPPWSRAIYVAPLLLDKTTYYSALYSSTNRFLSDPFCYRVVQSIYQRRWVSYFGTIPFLREHISIAPHERVADHNHYYAYSQAGVDISWHSPDIIARDPSRLSDFTVALFHAATADPEAMLPQNDLVEKTVEISSSLGFQEGIGSANESPLDYLGRHGRWLRQEHGIRQFILLGNSKHLSELRSDS
jgi:hypothetical protein